MSEGARARALARTHARRLSEEEEPNAGEKAKKNAKKADAPETFWAEVRPNGFQGIEKRGPEWSEEKTLVNLSADNRRRRRRRRIRKTKRIEFTSVVFVVAIVIIRPAGSEGMYKSVFSSYPIAPLRNPYPPPHRIASSRIRADRLPARRGRTDDADEHKNDII